jgi:hypothetical protein
MKLTDSRGLAVSTRSAWVLAEEPDFAIGHALIAYTAAARDEHQRRMLAKLEESTDGVHTNAIITRELGLPLARAIVAMSCERDLVQLTCNEAALRCGNGRLARALASERTEQKPTSPFNWELTARAITAERRLI